MPPLLFFGAGASRPFGIPIMTEMVDEFEKHVKENYPERYYLYNSIKEKLKRGYDVSQVDIESIFSVIDGIASGIIPKEFGHLPYYYISRFGSETKFDNNEIKTAQILKDELQKYIKSKCRVTISDEEKENAYRNSYEVVFSNLEGVSKTKNSRGFEYPIHWKAYTTNYDSIFEEFVAELTPLSDFFEKNESDIMYFNPAKQVQWQSFVKLHGSLDWIRLEDGNIIKSPNELYTRTKKKGTAMLYPIQQKDLYLNPWITLFQELKSGLTLCDLWYVVGYAFNDPFILEIFKEAFSDKKQMVLINPNADKIKAKFPNHAQSNIIPLMCRFGSKYFANDFSDFAKNIRRLEISIDTYTKDLFVYFNTSGRFLRGTNTGKEIKITETNTNNLQISFRSDNLSQKSIKFEIQLDYDLTYDYEFDMTIYTTDSTRSHVTIFNQERFIESFTMPEQTLDEKFYKSTYTISTKKFFHLE